MKKVLICLATGAVALAVVLSVHWWCERRRQARIVEERAVFMAKFGIPSDGKSEFVALPPELPHGDFQAKLGAELFCEKRLARTSRRTCAVCHPLNQGGSDGKVHGGVLTRPVKNAVFAPFYLHDGSVSNFPALVRRMLEDQQFSGVGSLDKAVVKLSADSEKLARFKRIYSDGMTPDNVVDSLVQYCHRLMTHGTAFDHYCGGDAGALNAEQKQGMESFRRRCLTCHDGPALGTLKMAKGLKVPSLRGLPKRPTYMTNGSLSDLGAVLSHMPGGDMEEAERAALIAFLKTL